MSRCEPWFKAVFLLVVPACAFDPLVEARPGEETIDGNLPGADMLEGIQVFPPVIHPGELVVLRDPVAPEDGPPYALYHWIACEGVVGQKSLLEREATWLAPREPGRYAVTLNITNRERERPSRVLSLCVAPDGADSCPSAEPTSPTRVSVVAEPDHFVDCPGGCEARLRADFDRAGFESATYHWQTRGGAIAGEAASVTWRLPRVSCCMETFTAVVAICAPGGRAGAGFANAMVEPE